MWMDLKGEKKTKEPGEIEGEGFLIDGCDDCELRIFDATSQVFIDYCKNTKIFIGAVAYCADSERNGKVDNSI